jgi:hypothetical protein
MSRKEGRKEGGYQGKEEERNDIKEGSKEGRLSRKGGKTSRAQHFKTRSYR